MIIRKLLFTYLFNILIYYINIIIYFHSIVKNVYVESSFAPFVQPLLMVTSCKTAVNHNQDTDIHTIYPNEFR